MQNQAIVSFAALAVVTFSFAAPSRAQTSSRCLSNPDTVSGIRAVIAGYLTAPRTPVLAAELKRAGVDKLTPSSLVLVTASSTCASASSGLDNTYPGITRNPTRRVYLIKGGNSRYFLWVPGPRGSTTAIHVLDSRFRSVSAWLGF
jgi:hypothetical protein